MWNKSIKKVIQEQVVILTGGSNDKKKVFEERAVAQLVQDAAELERQLKRETDELELIVMQIDDYRPRTNPNAIEVKRAELAVKHAQEDLKAAKTAAEIALRDKIAETAFAGESTIKWARNLIELQSDSADFKQSAVVDARRTLADAQAYLDSLGKDPQMTELETQRAAKEASIASLQALIAIYSDTEGIVEASK